VHRVAITRNKLVAMDDHSVTYRYQDRETNTEKFDTISGVDFLLKFAKHVMPQSLHKTRYAGLYHNTRKTEYDQAVEILKLKYAKAIAELAFESTTDLASTCEIRGKLRRSRKQCPNCCSVNLYVIREARYGELTNPNANSVSVGYANQTMNHSANANFQARHGP
jgi:hypothetical protein